MKKLPVIVTLLLASTGSPAHHGSNAYYDQSQSIELSGVITGVKWVNPHSYVHLDVTGADGAVTSWRCEMRAAAVLQRAGWSESMFQPGFTIDIDGVPSRTAEHTCYVRNLSIDGGPSIMRYEQLDESEEKFDDSGRPAVLPNGQPNISGNWAAPERLLQEGEERRRSLAGFRQYPFELTEAGEAAGVDFKVQRDSPRYYCRPVNIIADWVFDQHINHIEQTDDTITLTYGFMDIVRTIHLDMEKHPDNLQPSRAGHSIGHWEGNTLVVDTVGFLPGYLDGRFGIMHSDQLHVVERFEFNAAMQSLVRDYLGEDPLYLAEPFESRDAVFLTATPFEPYNCEELSPEFGEN